MKKLLCVVLSGIMAFSAFTVAVPITASAAESQESVSATYGNFEYTLEDDFTCTITGYNGTASNVTIPSTIYGNKVTKIGYSSFEENNNLMSVTLPNSIKYIDHYAFRSCENLKSITIPNSVKTIGSGVFSGCISLKNITVPSSVTELGSGVFDGCKNLINANFSYGIKEFSEYLFYNCISLTSINIPNSVKKVETDCFRGCTNLKSVSIGYGVEEIAFDWHPSFLYCNSLESITVNSNNKNFCSSDGVLFNKDKSEIKLYPKSKRNTNYIVPNSVKVLYCDDAMYGGNFTDCKYLKAITIPSNVTRIDDYAVGYNTNDWDFIKVSGFTIKGYKGTVAERYARNNDFNFVQLQVVPTSVALNKTTLTLDIGKTSNLRATVYPSNASNKKCTWSSSNTSVATVDGNGKVTAKASGTATITVKTSNGKTATCKVTVNLPAPQITGLANTTGGIKISWNKVSGAYGYRLYYKPASGGWKRFKDTTATSFTDSGVVPNKTETYTIRCIDKNGNTISGFNSTGWSKKYTPAAPTISKLDITTGGIKLS